MRRMGGRGPQLTVVVATVAVTVGLLGCLGSPDRAAAAGTRPVTTTDQAGFAVRKVASVWIPHWDARRSYRRVVSHSALFRTASPFWYDARCGVVHGHPGAGARWMITGLHRHRIDVVPTVTASSLRPRRAIRCLGRPGSLRRHVTALVHLARSRAYDGIDLDYEHLALTTSPRRAVRVRRAFAGFVERLCPALHRVGKRCVVTVMPRTSSRPRVWRHKLIPAVYDYARIAAAADRMRVMGYDQHASGTRPGPIAGYGWVRSVVRYTRSVAPAGKVELGIPLYGRDWAGRGATSLRSAAAVSLARREGVRPRFDPRRRESTYRYRAGGRRHTVWFSGARAVGSRVALARRQGLAGVAFWAPGMEARRTWAAVRARSRG
jgi:spore germination protein